MKPTIFSATFFYLTLNQSTDYNATYLTITSQNG